MNAPRARHPTPDDLFAFATGMLGDKEARVVAAHLKACPNCRRAVQRIPAASPTAGGTQLPGAPAGAPAPAAAAPDLPPELAAHPRYRILRELGRGGMGVVYHAMQTLMDRPVAIKVINQALLAHADALERFRCEVRAAAQLIHPNIVVAHDAEQAGSLHLLVMEYVEGESLAQLLQRHGPLPVTHACHYVRQAALGLQHAFEHGMIHRDIKPHNLMLTPKGQVKILDFGLAKVVREGGSGGGITSVNTYMGTPEYSAPEQATDARTADIRADLYSLGCTLYCLLTGRPPFRESSDVQTIVAHLHQAPRPLPEVRPDVPAGLWPVVARLLAKEPAARYQTPAEVAAALAPFCKASAKTAPVVEPGEPVAVLQATPVPSATLPSPATRKRSLLIPLFAVGAVSLALLAGVGTCAGVAGYPWLVGRLAERRAAREAEEARAAEEAAARQRAQQAKERAAQERAERQATNQVVVPLPGRDGTPGSDIPSGWADGSRCAVRQGDGQVAIDGLKMQDQQVRITLLIRNVGKNAPLTYHRWSVAVEDAQPHLLDQRGNVYRTSGGGKTLTAAAPSARPEVLAPGKTASESLFFEVPPGEVEYLRLELPASAFGGTGQLRLHLPKDYLLVTAPGLRGGKALPELRQALRNTTPDVRAAAANAFGELGPGAADAVGDLVEALSDRDDRVRAGAAQVLGKVGPPARLAIPALLQALGDRNAPVRASAARALDSLGPLTRADITALRAVLKSDQASARSYALRNLARIGLEPKDALPVFADALADPDPGIRTLAADALRRVGPLTAAEVPVLRETLKAAAPAARLHAVRALKQLGRSADAVVTDLVQLLHDPDREVRVTTAAALPALDRGSPVALAGLADALRDRDGDVRREAADALLRLEPTEAVRALTGALRDQVGDVRRDAAAALGRAGDAAKSAIPELTLALNDPSPVVRVGAARTLLKVGPPNDAVLHVLGGALQEDHVDLRRDAASLLDGVGAPARPVLPALATALQDKDPQVRQHAVSAVEKASDPRATVALPQLLRALRDKELRGHAFGAMARIGSAAVPDLLMALDDKDEHIRLGAAQALGKIGPAAQDAARALAFSSHNDKDAAVRRAAAEAVKAIRP
jgi:HEAT repeat protein